jgi:hypothetical protein
MFKEDNNGFVLFPHPNNRIVVGKDIGKTLVYLVAFEPRDKSKLSNVNIFLPGSFSSDDVVGRPEIDYKQGIDSLIEVQRVSDSYEKDYFPSNQDDLERLKSINLISAICLGWENKTYEFVRLNKFWNASFRDLTNEGQRLYYSMKKLHNSKEIRILTFNQI